MRVAFAQNIWIVLLGPALLAEIVERQGHEVRFFIERRGWLDEVRSWRPDVVCFSATTGNHRWVLEAATQLEAALQPAPTIVLGGPHATFFPDVIEHPALDAICRGEGEVALPLFLDGLTSGKAARKTPNFWVKTEDGVIKNELGPLVEDLSALPIPRLKIYDDYPFLAQSPNQRLWTNRGCPMQCSYCFNHVYRRMTKGKGPYLRQRSVDHVMCELHYVEQQTKVRHFEFVDDSLAIDKDWFLEFSERYRRECDLPYSCLLHVKHIDDDVARALSVSHCHRVMFGIESGNSVLRNEVLRRNVTDDDILRAVECVRRHKIPFNTYNMVGLPDETLEMAFETVRLNQQIRPVYAWCSIATPFPGTDLVRICQERGLNVGDVGRSFHDDSLIEQSEKNQLANLHKFFAVLVRFPWLERFVKLLLKLPATGLCRGPFKLLYQLYYGWQTMSRVKMSWWYGFRLWLRDRDHY